MVWVFGNSSERIQLKDLNDVIYFRQKKQFTDQEYESSKDLKREIKAGRIVKLEYSPDIKVALPDNIMLQQTTVTSKVDTQEIRRVIAEALVDQKPTNPQIDIKEILQAVPAFVKEHKTESLDIPSLVTSLIPIIAETVRQEIAKMPNQTVYVQSGQQGSSTSQSKFQDLAYVPEISSEGMKSSISIKDKTVEGSSVSGGLEALKKLNKSG